MQNMLDHMLSIHVRSRVFATLEDAAQFIKSVSMLYDAYVETKKIAKLKVKHRFMPAYSPNPQGALMRIWKRKLWQPLFLSQSNFP